MAPLAVLPPLLPEGFEALGFETFDISEERSVEKNMVCEMGSELKFFGLQYTAPRFLRTHELNLLSRFKRSKE